MARWSKATLVALGGFEKNVIIDELLFGEDNYYDITFLSDTLRTVVSFNSATNVVTFQGGDNTVFTVGDYVSFGDNSSLYLITNVGSTTITLAATPYPAPTNGQSIQVPINLTTATFQFRMRQQSADINDDPGNRDGATISNITPYVISTNPTVYAQEIDLDANVKTNVPSLSLALGQIRVLVNGGDLKPAPNESEIPPVLDTTTPCFYTGFIAVNLPAPDGVTPVQTKKQRICFVVRSDGTQLPAVA